MISSLFARVFLAVAVLPLIHYLIALFSSWRFFRRLPVRNPFTPPMRILNPIRGLDPEAYQNFASLCGRDYPECGILFLRERITSVTPMHARKTPAQRFRVRARNLSRSSPERKRLFELSLWLL